MGASPKDDKMQVRDFEDPLSATRIAKGYLWEDPECYTQSLVGLALTNNTPAFPLKVHGARTVSPTRRKSRDKTPVFRPF